MLHKEKRCFRAQATLWYVPWVGGSGEEFKGKGIHMPKRGASGRDILQICTVPSRRFAGCSLLADGYVPQKASWAQGAGHYILMSQAPAYNGNGVK